jgi:hypothetical protein
MTIKPQKSSLAIELDAFALTLIEEAKGNKLTVTCDEEAAQPQEKIDFGDRVSLFTALTRYLQVKNRIDPDPGEKDKWGNEFAKFHGRASGGKGRPRKGDTDPGADGESANGSVSPFPINTFRPGG